MSSPASGNFASFANTTRPVRPTARSQKIGPGEEDRALSVAQVEDHRSSLDSPDTRQESILAEEREIADLPFRSHAGDGAEDLHRAALEIPDADDLVLRRAPPRPRGQPASIGGEGDGTDLRALGEPCQPSHRTSPQGDEQHTGSPVGHGDLPPRRIGGNVEVRG